jgi:hypothetical protein
MDVQKQGDEISQLDRVTLSDVSTLRPTETSSVRAFPLELIHDLKYEIDVGE